MSDEKLYEVKVIKNGGAKHHLIRHQGKEHFIHHNGMDPLLNL